MRFQGVSEAYFIVYRGVSMCFTARFRVLFQDVSRCFMALFYGVSIGFTSPFHAVSRYFIAPFHAASYCFHAIRGASLPRFIPFRMGMIQSRFMRMKRVQWARYFRRSRFLQTGDSWPLMETAKLRKFSNKFAHLYLHYCLRVAINTKDRWLSS